MSTIDDVVQYVSRQRRKPYINRMQCSILEYLVNTIESIWNQEEMFYYWKLEWKPYLINIKYTQITSKRTTQISLEMKVHWMNN